jgi:hypothetical protein
VAAILSIVESCRRLTLPIRDYLAHVLPGLADRPSSKSNISLLLFGPPHNYLAIDSALALKNTDDQGQRTMDHPHCGPLERRHLHSQPCGVLILVLGGHPKPANGGHLKTGQ